MKTLRKISGLLTVLCLIYLSSCGSYTFNHKTGNNVEKKIFPLDLGKEGTTLLIHLGDQEILDPGLKEIIKEEYHGDYELITSKELDHNYHMMVKTSIAKYREKKKYRYLFSCSVFYVSNGPVESPKEIYSYDLQDRTNRKEGLYTGNANFGSFRKVIGNYMKALEQHRISHQSTN